MDTTKIALTERFTAFELAEMFNIDCNPECMDRKTVRVRYIDEPYAFNDTKVPLLIRRKRKVTKRVRPFNDSLKAGISEYEPGTKGRHADLVAWYAANPGGTPFEEGDDEVCE